MLDAILRAQGYKTGLYTSPHLVSFRERIKVNGRPIPKRSVLAFIDRYRKVLSRRKLSFFEVLTAMAFEHFYRTKVDVAVIETGLGGRLDASNVLSPILTVTTDISRDHVEILGSSLAKIAFEKAGIIKPSVPHLIGLLPEPAEKVISRRCEKLKAPLHRLHSSQFAPYLPELALDFKYNGFSVKRLSPALLGTHQIKNAALVLRAVPILRQEGLSVSKRAVLQGIKNTRWPGRFQVVDHAKKPTHIFDVGHNAAGVEAFVGTFKLRYPGRKAHIITGFVQRKEHLKMFASLTAIAESFALVPLATHRTVDIDELIPQVDWRGIPYRKFGSLATAYNTLLKKCTKNDILIIMGSHYLVGEFFSKFRVR